MIVYDVYAVRVKTGVYSHGHMIQPGRANLHRSFPKHPFSLRELLPQLLLLTNHAVSEMQGKRDDPENSPEIVVKINAVAYCMHGKCKVYILCCSMFSMLFIHPTSQNTHVTRNISEYNILIYMYCIYICQIQFKYTILIWSKKTCEPAKIMGMLGVHSRAKCPLPPWRLRQLPRWPVAPAVVSRVPRTSLPRVPHHQINQISQNYA
jgi:hypothetical protein